MNLLDRVVATTLPIVPKPIVRFFSKRYIAGTTIDDAFAVVRDLASQGAMSTLDILGEFISTREQAVKNTDAYVELVERIGRDRMRDTHVSVKLTALGLLIDQQACLDNMRRLMQQIEQMPDTITSLLSDPDAFRRHIASLRSECVYNLGHSAQAAAEAIVGLADHSGSAGDPDS